MMAGRSAVIIDRWMQVTFLLERAASPRILTPLCSFPHHHHTCEKSPVGSPAYWSPKHLENLLFVLEGELEWDSGGGGGGTERPTPSSRHQYAVVWYSSSAETRRPVHGILIFFPKPILFIAPWFHPPPPPLFSRIWCDFFFNLWGKEGINLTEITEWRNLSNLTRFSSGGDYRWTCDGLQRGGAWHGSLGIVFAFDWADVEVWRRLPRILHLQHLKDCLYWFRAGDRGFPRPHVGWHGKHHGDVSARSCAC